MLEHEQSCVLNVAGMEKLLLLAHLVILAWKQTKVAKTSRGHTALAPVAKQAQGLGRVVPGQIDAADQVGQDDGAELCYDNLAGELDNEVALEEGASHQGHGLEDEDVLEEVNEGG